MGNRQSLDKDLYKKIINDHFNQIIKKVKNGDKEQIEKINEIKEINLEKLDMLTDVDNERLKSIKVCNQIKELIIKEDCVLLDDPHQPKRSILCLTSWFYNQKNLDFIEKIYRFR